MLDLYVISDVIIFVVKYKSLKLREDSDKVESYFVAFTSKEVENPKTTISPLMSTKAIAVQALSPKKYIVLDSDGSLHLLLLSNSTHGPEITVQMRQLIYSMKVQKLAVHPDISLSMLLLISLLYFIFVLLLFKLQLKDQVLVLSKSQTWVWS